MTAKMEITIESNNLDTLEINVAVIEGGYNEAEQKIVFLIESLTKALADPAKNRVEFESVLHWFNAWVPMTKGYLLLDDLINLRDSLEGDKNE